MKASEALEIAREAARAAGEEIRRRAARAEEVRHKGEIDLVTEVDLACERRIREVLERRCPQVPVLAEEGGGARGEPTRWLVDPLDGTTNFVHGLPHFAVSVALQWEGELLAGCVLDPSRGEEFFAARGLGAFLGPRQLEVSRVERLNGALLATGFPYDRRRKAAFYLRPVQAVLEHSQGIRRAGAAALDLAWVAAGRLDGFYELGLAPWDVAAGALLVSEAGGLVEQIEGGPLDLDAPRVLASNGRIQAELRRLLTPLVCYPPHEEPSA